MTLVDAALVREATRTSVNLLRLVRVGILLMSLLEGRMRPRTIPLLMGDRSSSSYATGGW